MKYCIWMIVVALAFASSACDSNPEVASDQNASTTGAVAATGGAMETGGVAEPLPETGGIPAATGGADMTGGVDAGTREPTGPGSCGAPRTTPGCDDQAVMDCVCAGAPECCDTAWDLFCVGLAANETFECKGDCCNATGAKGCADAAVEAAVCAAHPPCCERSWDDFCTILAEANGAVCQ